MIGLPWRMRKMRRKGRARKRCGHCLRRRGRIVCWSIVCIIFQNFTILGTRASLKSKLKLHQYLWKLFGSQKEFSNVSLHEELCVPLCGWRILSTNSDTLGRLYLLRLMFVALFGSWKEIVMDNWGRLLLQRVRNCINIVDSGQDTAEKYSWLQRTQKACFGFHSALREAMQNPTCRNGDLQWSCIIFEKSGFWGRVKILSIDGLMSIKREEVCTMV